MTFETDRKGKGYLLFFFYSGDPIRRVLTFRHTGGIGRASPRSHPGLGAKLIEESKRKRKYQRQKEDAKEQQWYMHKRKTAWMHEYLS